jgi:hypothetical protein
MVSKNIYFLPDYNLVQLLKLTSTYFRTTETLTEVDSIFNAAALFEHRLKHKKGKEGQTQNIHTSVWYNGTI